MDMKQREKMLNGFADPEVSDKTTFQLHRDKNDGLTFTQEALEDFREMVFLFIGGRMTAFIDKHDGKPPQHLVVEINVKVE